MKNERIDKILSSQGFGSRKEVQSILRKGLVKVNDIIVKKPDIKCNPSIDKISVFENPLVFKKYMYIMMNKPKGVLSASKDPNAKTVIDLVPKHLKRNGLFPAGRLDKDTEGLMIITNDGPMAHRMLSPKKKVYKKYFAVIDGKVTPEEVLLFERGVEFNDGTICKPAFMDIISSSEKSEVTISICEGKFHQIKKMFISVGMSVLYLKRLQIGGLELDPNLALGECKELSLSEIGMVFTVCT